MTNKRIAYWVGSVLVLSLLNSACSIPRIALRSENKSVPASYAGSQDTTNTGQINTRGYFTDPYLYALIDMALYNNQELNITKQEIQIANNEILARQGAYMPTVNVGGGAGVEKVSRYTSKGAADEITDIKPGLQTPAVLPNAYLGAFASWEVDIWHKLRNARKSAVVTYLGSIEGRNFTVTNIVSEIANNYYELLTLDTQLDIIQRNLVILNNALSIVRQEKEAAKVTELAVRRFEAEVLKTKSLQYDIQQNIVEKENRINFLVGRFPQRVQRDSQIFNNLVPNTMLAGIPSQLLVNRPDIRQAERNLEAANLDVGVARANFLPSLNITGSVGLMAFNPIYLFNAPQSLMASLLGDLTGPWINRRGITALYRTASARQIQAVYNYERTVLNAHIEVANQLAYINNMAGKYTTKSSQVDALVQSTSISLKLFASARADYMEVLLTQRDVLEARMELAETKMRQLHATVNTYRALGGGWR